MAVLRGAKNLRVATSLGGVIPAAYTAFFKVGAASFVLCRFRLRTSLKPSSWVVEDLGFLGRARFDARLQHCISLLQGDCVRAIQGAIQGLPTEGFSEVLPSFLRRADDG
jgi:hypothetical protein